MSPGGSTGADRRTAATPAARAEGGEPRCAARSATTPTAGSSTRARPTRAPPRAVVGPAPQCERRFTTVEEAVLAVVKRSGVSEPFNRSKVVAGVRRACQGRPVDEDQLQLLAQQVEDAIRATGAAEVPSHEVGLAILRPAARARRGRLPALRERLPRPSPRVGGLREGDRRAQGPQPCAAGDTRRPRHCRTADPPATRRSAPERRPPHRRPRRPAANSSAPQR